MRADDPSLIPHAGFGPVGGELARRLGLAELIDAELAVERRARPVKVRGRGASPGELVVSLAECRLVGGSFFDHVEDVRADRAGAAVRAVAATPSAPAAVQNAKRFRRCHVQRIERAAVRADERLDRALGRDPAEPVTIDHGRHAGHRLRTAQAGRRAQPPRLHELRAVRRELGAARARVDLGAGERQQGEAVGRRMRTDRKRAISLLPEGHGRVTIRIDSAHYAAALLHVLRTARARFTVSVPRNQAMWKALAQIPESAWTDALDMPGAQVAETAYRPDGCG
jgi:hypothetical protein